MPRPSVLAYFGFVPSIRGAAATGNGTEVLVLPTPPSPSRKMMTDVKGLEPPSRGLEKRWSTVMSYISSYELLFLDVILIADSQPAMS